MSSGRGPGGDCAVGCRRVAHPQRAGATWRARVRIRWQVAIDSLREDVEGGFDRRGEYLYEEGFAHLGFDFITFTVDIESQSPPEQIRAFVSWAERSPPHATLRRAVRLVGIFRLNGRHLATAVYHPDRTEWRGLA